MPTENAVKQKLYKLIKWRADPRDGEPVQCNTKLLNEDQLASFVLAKAGGGWTQKQTEAAMKYQSKLKNGDRLHVALDPKGETYTLVDMGEDWDLTAEDFSLAPPRAALGEADDPRKI